MADAAAAVGPGGDSVRLEVTVACPAQRAFALFAEGMDSWWPREYTWSQEVLDTIGLEPFEGGRCFERGPHAFACDWGRVLVWEPPERLVLSWQIAPDRTPEPNPARASEVEVLFTEEGDEATRVTLEHRGFERHGEGGAGYREALGSPEGWELILARYAAAISAI